MSPTSSPHRLAGLARDLTLQAAAEIRADWSSAGEVIARITRGARALSSRDRRLLGDTVFDLIRFDRRLDAIVVDCVAAGRGGSARALHGDPSPVARDELKLLVHELRSGADAGAVTADIARCLGRPIRPDAILGDDAGLGRRTDLDREATRLSFPTWMMDRFVADLGREPGLALARALNRRAPLCVLANTTRTSREALRERLRAEGVEADPCPLSRHGLTLAKHVNVNGLPSFREGLFDVMDEGSQLVAEVVMPDPESRVADVCAGAGGKTLALAAIMHGKGRVLAMDVAGKKIEELRRRARRAGFSNVVARAIESVGPGAALPAEEADFRGTCDRVLVDAPCSGSGALRRSPELRWQLSAAVVKQHASTQLGLLVDYSGLTAPRGRLIYATCSVFADENQRVIERFLAERPDFHRIPLSSVVGKARADALGDGDVLQLLPGVHEADGFFAAVLERGP